jgi:hypothetical protein
MNGRLQIFPCTAQGIHHPVYSNCIESGYLMFLRVRMHNYPTTKFTYATS